MRDVGMELLRRIFSSLGFDCLNRGSSSTPSNPAKAAERDPPHCQCCIAFDVRLKRLTCGHLFCNYCTGRIINQAFQDIEGLCDYPCPMCKSISRLNGAAAVPPTHRPLSRTPGDARPASPLQKEVIREEEEEEEDEGVPGDWEGGVFRGNGGVSLNPGAEIRGAFIEGTVVLSCVDRPGL